jgi:hypothetical protein
MPTSSYDFSHKGLGAHLPTDKPYAAKYPWRALSVPTPFVVNKSLSLPWWHKTHDQGQEGACVGFGTTMLAAIVNTQQRKAQGIRPNTVRYDPWWLWDQAKAIDYWPETQPGDNEGTSVDAACQIMASKGLVKYSTTARLRERLGLAGHPGVASPEEGITAYRWATTVDEMRAAIAAGLPLSIGVNWYQNFDGPEVVRRGVTPEAWIGRGELGSTRGGHCVCVYGASDRRQAFRIKNSWGAYYPEVWMPYETMQRLLDEYGEACIITDR